MKRGALTLAFALAILVSSTFTRHLVNWARATIGRSGMAMVLWVVAAIGAVVVLQWFWQMGRVRLTIALVLLAIAGWYLSTFNVVEERVHFMKFALLAFLACRDTRRSGATKAVVSGIVLAALVGGLDEVFQHYIPGRVGDPRDVLFDATGGVWGAVCWRVGWIPRDTSSIAGVDP